MDKQKQIINFLKYLSLHGVSPKSLKYYKSDFISFLNWAGNKKINQSSILEYINSIRAVTPISTLKRRQSTLRSYASFMGFKKVSNTWQESILYAFTKKPRLQNFFHKLFFSRPNWYRTYHSYQLATYIHVAILVLFTSIAGFAVYDQIFNTKNNLLAFPTALTRPNRYLSFQGRLTSNVGNPITTATNLVFKLYDASTAGSELWTSGTCSITPDQDGIFSTLLGTTTNCPTATEIAATVFSENASVWVGVTVAADAEATPRVQIATVAYALNTETLQGYPAGTGTSTIPYIDSSGTVVLASASPKIQSTSGTFAVEGLAMTITTPNASNGVITVNPDGTGTLDLTFEGTAAGLSANGFVNATNANITSGALYGGTVASAATGYNFIDFQGGVSPTSKFSVSAVGDVTLAGDLTVSGSSATLPNDSISPNEVLSTSQTDEYCLTYEATGTTWEWQSCAAAGGGSWSALTVPTANLSLAHAGYTTAFTFDSVTTADAFALSSSSLTTGTILDLSSTSTAGGASGSSKILDITRSGTNSNASHTAYGLYSAVTNTGTTSTNVGGYFSASGATNNYGLIVENGSVGIGTATPTYRLDVRGASTGIGFDVSDAYPVIIPTLNATVEDIKFSSLGNGGNLYLSAPGTDATNSYIDFATAGSSKMRILNSGKVQIGTATQTHTLDAGDLLISSDLELDGNLYLDGGTITNSAGTASLILSATPTTTANTLSASNWLIENTANVGQSALIINQTKAGDLFTASASGTPKFTITNAGNVGIGTTGPGNTLHVVTSGAEGMWLDQSSADNFAARIRIRKSRGTTASPTIVQDGDELGYYLMQGYDGSAYRTAGWMGAFVDGTPGASDMPTKLQFATTNDGASGATIKMVIKNDGNVGIGTTGPGNTLHVVTSGAEGMWLDQSSADNFAARIRIRKSRGTTASPTIVQDGDELGYYLMQGYDGSAYRTAGWMGAFVDGTPGASDMPTKLQFATTNDGASGATIKMVIKNDGNVGIGTTGPVNKFEIATTTADPSTSGSAANGFARLVDSTGSRILDFGIGSAATPFSWLQSRDKNTYAVNYALSLNPNGGNVGIGTTGPGYLLTVNSSTPGCNGCTAWTNYSDSRLKENIVNLSGDILDKIMDLKPVTFNYNDAYYSQTGYSRPDGTTPTFTGFVAQDLQQIFPEMVSTASSGYLDTNLSNLQIYLVKGIQEQQGKIASLSGQLASLLQIDGSCVTGDTILPIRRKKKKRNSDEESDDEYEDLLCRIDEILPGDEVLSLNESTGALEHARINKLKDMDIKEVYELTTKSGKVIRTTANHPYLTLSEDNPIANEEKINI